MTSSPSTAGVHGLMRSLTDRVSAESESGMGVRGENMGVGVGVGAGAGGTKNVA